MGREIERKFLVASDSWRDAANAGTLFSQGYLSTDPDRSVRVRVAGAAAYLTVKGRSEGAGRSEFEYEIPVADARELLALCARPPLEKTRYRVPFGGKTWEVDVFHGVNDGLVVAEIELEDEAEDFAQPNWAGDEVTGEARYYNLRLSEHPYRDW